MDTRVEKRIGVRAPAERIWEVIADLPGWTRWNPYEAVEGAIGFGAPLSVREALPDLGPREAVAHVNDWQPLGQLVWLEKRGLWFRSIRYFEIEELAPGACIVANGALFTGLRGELFHDKHRKRLRAAYEDVAEGLRRAAEG